MARRSYMEYGLECLEPTLFNRSKGVMVNMKEQLTKAKEGKLKNFVYGVILVSFALQWFPLIQPQHIILELINPSVPQIRRWINHMSRHVGPSVINFSPIFFGWLRKQLNMIKKSPYMGMDFHDVHELVLLEGEE